MTIRLNDQPREIAESATLQALLRELGLAGRRGVAIAVNDTVAPRSTWETHPLVPADRVLVIQATQGG